MLYFKHKQEAASHNSNILYTFNGNLDEDLVSQQGIPLDYGSELREPTGNSNLFHNHEDRDKIKDTTQKGPQYHLSPI